MRKPNGREDKCAEPSGYAGGGSAADIIFADHFQFYRAGDVNPLGLSTPGRVRGPPAAISASDSKAERSARSARSKASIRCLLRSTSTLEGPQNRCHALDIRTNNACDCARRTSCTRASSASSCPRCSNACRSNSPRTRSVSSDPPSWLVIRSKCSASVLPFLSLLNSSFTSSTSVRSQLHLG